MIEFVGWADEKGEGQPRANEMRGVFVRGRMQQFRVNSEQRMLVLTDSQQEPGQIRVWADQRPDAQVCLNSLDSQEQGFPGLFKSSTFGT